MATCSSDTFSGDASLTDNHRISKRLQNLLIDCKWPQKGGSRENRNTALYIMSLNSSNSPGE